MRSLTYTFVVLLLLVIAGCTPSKEQLSEKINEAEAALYGSPDEFKFDEDLANEAVSAYDAFISNYPKDSMVPTYLFKSAELKKALGEFEAAIDDYNQLAENYPEAEKAPHSVFLQGFIYENELGQSDKARPYYEQFLEKYPNHELADDVEFSLQHLGKSADDIIKEFESKGKSEQQQMLDSLKAVKDSVVNSQ